MFPVIILLGGENSRFWPLGVQRHKALYEVGRGIPLLEYTLEDCALLGVPDVVLVHRPTYVNVLRRLCSKRTWPFRIHYARQEHAGGMAHAVLSAVKFLPPTEAFFVSDGNQLSFAIIARMLASERMGEECALAVQSTNESHRFGIVFPAPDGRRVETIQEKPRLLWGPHLRICGLYCLHRSLLEYVERYTSDAASGFEKALDQYAKEKAVVFQNVESIIEDLSLKYPWELPQFHITALRKDDFPAAPLIDQTAVVHPTAIVEGKSIIGAQTRICEYAVVKNSIIREQCIVGTYSLVRDSLLCPNVLVGAYCEVARSLLYEEVELHRNYVGDSILDEGVHMGAGTITANKRHDRKSVRSMVKGQRVDSHLEGLGAVIGAGAAVGINCSLRPGVKIAPGARIEEATKVTQDIA